MRVDIYSTVDRRTGHIAVKAKVQQPRRVRHVTVDEFEEANHPRGHAGNPGQFSSTGGGGSGGEAEGSASKPAPAATTRASRLKAHAETFKKHGAETIAWVKDVGAAGALKSVVSDPRAQKILSFSLQSLLSHGTTTLSHLTGGAVPSIEGLDPGLWNINEQLVENVMHHYAEVAAVTTAQAKATMKAGVMALIALRKKKAAAPGDAEPADDKEDGVLAVLEALLDLLDDEDDDEKSDEAAADCHDGCDCDDCKTSDSAASVAEQLKSMLPNREEFDARIRSLADELSLSGLKEVAASLSGHAPKFGTKSDIVVAIKRYQRQWELNNDRSRAQSKLQA